MYAFFVCILCMLGVLVVAPPPGKFSFLPDFNEEDYEQPTYRNISVDGNIEIRVYEPMIVARVEVTGNRMMAGSKAFFSLFGYIAGANRRREGISMTAPVQQQESQQISMTAPVHHQESQQISMTAPVHQQQRKQQSWLVSFIMPAQFTMQTIPTPTNDQVRIAAIPAQKFIVIRFSGASWGQNVAEHRQALADYVASNGVDVMDVPPVYASYNAPFTPLHRRRNEIMLQMEMGDVDAN